MKNDEEYEEQCALAEYLQILKNNKKIVEFFSIENENKQSFTNRSIAIKIANKQTKSGKKNGVSDMCIVLKNQVLFIEMKKKKRVLKSGKLSTSGISVEDSQVEFLETVTQSNVADGSICYGAKEAIDFIDSKIKA